ncbi:16S rRNA (cytidine(1402)-2'-O)-methyltransferase [Gulosibacter molinativorax]|uniref:Ribosomal RNA small subunit methyltransferase I n=1 Tax=Gulosibacter molinativorax TaxID=256821 RepID=A0ABT7C6L6_9MICO|nr:16S rRNA (cytidine(1402)-2'-O)-methyltransferase [Gulosibacter molinativorax]MDJ1370853.1 16S rRNA (cytidine(1402)-2'-O)-methyltransferase [Gulosibacter molinativorax]QUY62191.1 Ribosomal RNA small subunit methyltransferase I [Gulosibacter molinativorax]
MLILAGTPIGNLGDASTRLIETLRAAEIVACEDTRTTAKLLNLLEIESRPRLIALHEHNERELAAEIAQLASTQDVVLVSDAGMPAISDPGYPVVRACIEADVAVTSVPGPSAVITALAVSGLPTDRFTFEGFMPRKAGERAAVVAALGDEPRTSIFYESPHRLAATLEGLAAAHPDRQVVVCRELTKLHEETVRGSASELAEWAREGVRGEIVLLVAGAEPGAVDEDAALVRVLELQSKGMRLKDAAAEVATATGLRKRDLYEAALAADRIE